MLKKVTICLSSILILLSSFVFFLQPIQANQISNIYTYNRFDSVLSQSNNKSGMLQECSNFCEYTEFDTQLTQSSYLDAGDIDNDGINEIVSSSFYDGYIAILKQNGIPNDLELVALWDVNTDPDASRNGIAQIKIIDVSNDNKPDIVVTDAFNTTIFGFIQTGVPGEFYKVKLVDFTDYYSIASSNVGDFNNDGKNDIVLTAYDDAYVYLNINGTFVQTHIFHYEHDTPVTNLYDEPAIADVNGDNLSDLIVTDGYANNLYVWLSPNMEGIFIEAPGNRADNITIGDLDNDGIDDIATAGGGTKTVRVYWGGTFNYTDLTAQGEYRNMWDAVIGSIDDSNKNVLVVTNEQSFTIHMWEFNSQNDYSQEVIDASVIPGEIILKDVNDDNFNDVLYGLAGYTSPPHAPVTVHFNTNVVEPTKYPDLIPTKLTTSYPKYPTLQAQVNMDIDISNIGNEDSSNFVVRIEALGMNLYKEIPVQSLNAGQSMTLNAIVTGNKWVRAIGYKITVDATNQIEESNEENNELVRYKFTPKEKLRDYKFEIMD